MKVLVLNAGSSTQKSRLYDLSGKRDPLQAPPPLWEAHVDWDAGAAPRLTVTAGGGQLVREFPGASRPEVLGQMLGALFEGETAALTSPGEVAAVGHRIVHGGTEYTVPALIDEKVHRAIADLIPLAPAHHPAHLEGIDAVAERFPGTPQVAVFDTAFHRHMPEAAALYPLPYEWYEHGVRRYGFHGISHRYAAQRAAQLLEQPLEELRVVTCHLGNGCSLAAVHEGRSVDTTMGFSPLEGLMMGTRSGSIDPAIPLYLIREHGYDAARLDALLNRESGLKGVSGLSGDMREILEAADGGHERARLALEVYGHRLRRLLGAMLAVLGGAEALVFTGGVGENAAAVRAAACETLNFAGIHLDAEANRSGKLDADLSVGRGATAIFIVHAEEDWAIARECHRLLG